MFHRGEVVVGQRAELFREQAREVRVGVHARAHGGTTLGNAQQVLGRLLDAVAGVADLVAPSAQLLGQGHRHGIHQVGAAGLDHGLGFLLAARDGLHQVIQARQQGIVHLGNGAQVDGRGNHVVAALAHVDVVVGVDRLAAVVGGQARDHLVHVHVGAGAGTRLEHVHGELIHMGAAKYFITGGLDGLGPIRVQQAQYGVGARGAALDPHHGMDEGAGHGPATYREVVDGALGLGRPEGVGRDFHLAETVFLDALVTHSDLRQVDQAVQNCGYSAFRWPGFPVIDPYALVAEL